MSEVYPPNLAHACRDIVRDAELLIQAFIMNVFGALDNLALIWALERKILRRDGNALSRTETVFVGSRRKVIYDSLTPNIKAIIDDASEWFAQIGAYRHGVAHQIPVYIPRLFSNADLADAERLGAAIEAELANGERATAFQLMDERHQLGDYGGWMALGGKDRPMMLHPQMVCDLATVVNLAEVIFVELDAPST